MGCLRQNNIKFQLKKYIRAISHERSLKKKWIVVSNMTWGILWIFTQPLQNFTSMGYFCLKYMIFELKNTEELSFMKLNWWKIWINADLVVSKMAWGIGWTFITALKNLENCPFLSKGYMFQLEKFKGIMCHHTEG